MKKIGFIGAGNMAHSIIGGMLNAGYDATAIRAADPILPENNIGIDITSDNNRVARWADIIILAVKPQTLKAVCTNILQAVQNKKPLIISVAAGIRSEAINNWTGGNNAIIRVMPNTPALIGQGMSGMFFNEQVSNDQKQIAEKILGMVGKTVWLDREADIDSVTAISGSGPAYFLLFIEALIDAATNRGLPPETARVLALQTALGAAQMASESTHSVTKLRHQITSPGGTTEQAIDTLKKGQLTQLINQAVDAAAKRSAELAEKLGQ